MLGLDRFLREENKSSKNQKANSKANKRESKSVQSKRLILSILPLMNIKKKSHQKSTNSLVIKKEVDYQLNSNFFSGLDIDTCNKKNKT